MALPHVGKKAYENSPLTGFCPTLPVSFNVQVIDHSNSMFDSDVECSYEGEVCLDKQSHCFVMIIGLTA